ncbi:hypothetical protein B0A55_10750 [Friedmanniomyces simplex]|uniref:6-phosphogluconate dehydrogenase NADP-binding domain-containing protein n=1 Tax=Friedmanniomyces simplex TaxID=329884 RepID=A0A4U0WU24_9PEZI|nr:hypothetical protein B0A55_10750 [Friedmanniomyces simplex]
MAWQKTPTTPTTAVNTTTCNGETYAYQELAGYGYIASDARDKFGDTIGGIGSSVAIDRSSWRKLSNGSYEGLLYAIPDRGWNTEGTVNYQNRVQKIQITFTPDEAATVTSPSGPNLQLAYLDTILFTDPSGTPTTGLDADLRGPYLQFPSIPFDLPSVNYTGDGFGGNGTGGHRVVIDSEGLFLGQDGTFWVSDEYGPYVYHFSNTGRMIGAIRPPNAFIPLRNNSESFSADSPPIYDPSLDPIPADNPTGRDNNQGLEGLTTNPAGTRLYTLMQSALNQEGGLKNKNSRNSRFTIYDITTPQPTYLAEYIVSLNPVNASDSGSKIAHQSEIHYVSDTQFLVLARDSGEGRGQGNDTESIYRHVDIFDISKATDIKGAAADCYTCAIASTTGTLDSNVTAAEYCPWLDFNVNSQLNRFGVHNGGAQDDGLLNEKWESIALMPVNPNTYGSDEEFYLFSMSDNDFITQNGYLDGGKFKYADASGYNLLNQMLVFKVKLPGGSKPLMCAPLYVKMNGPHISRFNSQSTGNATLVGSDNGLGSPTSPYHFYDSSFLPASAVPYTGQWFYLDQVPPKLLRELQRQCDPSTPTKDSPKHPLAKSAAKIKAWARPGKLGIDIKLRQKINAEHDEVTQIRLEPELDFLEHKRPLAEELPGSLNEICELADENEPQELPTEPLERPMSAVLSDVETLPRYEACRDTMVETTQNSSDPTGSLLREQSRGRRNSVSGFSFVPTPPRGLSLSRADEHHDVPTHTPGDCRGDKALEEMSVSIAAAGKSTNQEQYDLARVNSQLQQEREIRTRYESLLQDVREELSRQRHERQQSADSGVKQMLTGLKVAKTARYETETDVEPPSPSDAQDRYVRARKAAVKPKRKQSDHTRKGSNTKTQRDHLEPTRQPQSADSHQPKARRRSTDSFADAERSPSPPRAAAPTTGLPAPSVTFSEPIEEQLESQRNSNLEQSSNGRPVQRQKLPLITTTFHPASKEPSPLEQNVVYGSTDPWLSHRPPHKPQGSMFGLVGSVLIAVSEGAIHTIEWVRRKYGPEPDLEPGKVRVRWTCSCGKQLYDDYVEKRSGAARELEAYLNRPRTHTGGSPTTPSSTQSSRVFSPNGSFGMPASSHTSMSSNGFTRGTPGQDGDTKPPRTFTALPPYMPFKFPPEPPWLLTCANEDRHTPKLAHLDMSPQKIRSDKDLALSLRDHYFNVNKKWWRTLRLRGLSTINFVQFEVHQNRFADIRKCPDVPMAGHSDYNFVPGDLLPPVGSHYLLHLFKHPEDYDGELITYLRAPKKTGRLQLGVGWGINLVEGFEAPKVWLMISGFFATGSLVFAIAWAWKKQDVQGAFGVAAQATQDRARENSVDLVETDVELCNAADYILSIVPPRDALATAQRIVDASSNSEFKKRSDPLHYIDLNAISPQSARRISELFSKASPEVRLIDGGIIGGPPSREAERTWSRPSIPVSGPHKLCEAAPGGKQLADVLNVKHVSVTIGAATGLKMCFASLSKGFTALAIESFTTAHNLGVTDQLRAHLEEFNPMAAKMAERGLVNMPPKAYRWVHEMDEIAETFEADGGFERDESIFRPIARVYDLVANGTDLGKEITEDRKRGKTAEDVALLMGEGTKKRKEKTE